MISANCASCKRGHSSSKNAPKSDAVAVFGLIDRIFFAVSCLFQPTELSFDAGRRSPTANLLILRRFMRVVALAAFDRVFQREGGRFILRRFLHGQRRLQ